MSQQISVTVEGGGQSEFPKGTTAEEALGSKLASNCVGALVDGRPVDLSYRLEADCSL